MMPLSITVTGFGSFKAAQTLVFPEGPGLYFMGGRNEVEPALGGNAAGKSTVWQALFWLFTGKTSDGLRAGDAANWDMGKGTVVELCCMDGWGEQFIIRRTWGPISWQLIRETGEVEDLAKDETNAVLAMLRLNFQSFLNSVYMAQGEDMFLDLKPEAKAALFSEVMGLDNWVDASKRALKTADEWDVKQRRLEQKLAEITGQLRSVAAAADVTGHERDWERERTRKHKVNEEDHARLLARVRAAADAIEVETEAEAEAKAILVVEQEQARAGADAVERARAALESGRLALDRAEGARSRAEQELDLIEGNEDDTCPSCGQEITAAHKRQELRRVSAALAGAETDVTEHKGIVAGLVTAVDRARAAAADLEATAKATRDHVQDVGDRVRSLRREVADLNRDLDDIEADDDVLMRSRNPFADVAENGRQEQQRLQQEHDRVRAEVEHADSQRSLAMSCSKWFKEVRLARIAEALTQLEIEVNAEAHAHGLLGWELKFEVDRETATGTIHRGFQVTVLSPHNKKAVPWEAWSGGESQRLRCATQQGLSNLIRQRTGTPLDLEIWDEPTNWMSAQGVTHLLEALRARAQREQLQIWVVDHRSLGYGGFSGGVTVVKDSSGSRFEKMC